MKNSGKVTLSLVSMFAAGVVAGILFAPARGKRTRNRITRKGENLVKSVEDAFQEGKTSLVEIRESIIEKIETLKEELIKCESKVGR